MGTVFAVKTNGADFTVLWTFSELWHAVTNPEIDWNFEGAQPNSLILKDNVLYGTASAGAFWGRGSVFAINPNGVVLWVPYTFSDLLPQLPYSVWPFPRTNGDGVAPLSGLFSEGNTVYGTTTGGGPFTAGTILSLVLPPPQLAFTTQTNNNEIRITGFVGSGKSVFIPPEINGLPVTSIGTNAFAGAVSLTNIIIPDSVMDIGESAFQGCGVISIRIPNSVTNIGDYAFARTSLTNVTIPNSVIEIGESPFEGCTNLTTITVDPSNPAYSSVNGVLLDIGRSLLMQYPARRVGGYSIPSSVTTIGDHAFFNCLSLTSITIPNSVTIIGGGAFGGCANLTSVTIPNSVTSIGEAAFQQCIGLTSLTIGNGVTSIGGSVFARCDGLTSVTIPNSVSSVGDSAFAGCYSLTNVSIPNGVTSIGDGSFAYCSGLTSVTIPDSVTTIGDNAFGVCISLSRVYFQGDAPKTSSSAFATDPTLGAALYLPGTAGWAGFEFETNHGVYTAAWTLPYPLVLQKSLGVRTNNFGFTISWATNRSVIVEASVDWAKNTWTPVATNVLNNGVVNFRDQQWTNYPRRFYRARSP